MTILNSLKEAESLTDVAKLLGFTPKGLSYVIYKIDNNIKYNSFNIPKNSGGFRTIKSPQPQLALLQRRLSDVLSACVRDQKKNNARFWASSHGFHQGRTIVSNADVHKNCHFVFNIDLENFFDTINFGRVRGFFIRDHMFNLHPNVATILAQIACHDNSLPQGSPCSPIISNLVGNILDVRLLALARDSRCTYTRYADDLTFSTNEKPFPIEIALNVHGAEWEIGKKLKETIDRAGFYINPVKTRMSIRQSRQTVTGLVVNDKVNVNRDYYRTLRAMCNSLFQSGKYHKAKLNKKVFFDNLNYLEGALSHVYFVKSRRDRSERTNKLAIEASEFLPSNSFKDLYRNFLFYKYFVAPSKPIIVTEGITDIIYIQCALRELHTKFPRLATVNKGKFFRRVQFLKPSGTSRDLLHLAHGSAGQASLISRYSGILKRYSHRPMKNPVVILCDNDNGSNEIMKAARKKSKLAISETTTNDYYHLGENLYLIKIPEGVPPGSREIESLFSTALLSTTLDGKTFDPKKDHGDDTHYGKKVFAESVVRANAPLVDFSEFEMLLSRIEGALSHFSALTPPAATAASMPPSP